MRQSFTQTSHHASHHWMQNLAALLPFSLNARFPLYQLSWAPWLCWPFFDHTLPSCYDWTSLYSITFWFLPLTACSSEVLLGWEPQKGSLHTEIGGCAVTFESSSSPDSHGTCGEPQWQPAPKFKHGCRLWKFPFWELSVLVRALLMHVLLPTFTQVNS